MFSNINIFSLKRICLLQFNPTSIVTSNKHLLVGSSDGTIKKISFMKMEKKKPKILSKHKGSIDLLSISKGGIKLASYGKDMTIRIWGIKEGITIRVIKLSERNVQHICFSPNIKNLIYSSPYKVHLICLDSGYEIKRIGGHSYFSKGIGFNSEGSLIISSSSHELKINLLGTNQNDFTQIMCFYGVAKRLTEIAQKNANNNSTENNKIPPLYVQFMEKYLKKYQSLYLVKKLPFDFTLIHLLCYLDNTTVLKQLLIYLKDYGVFVPPTLDNFDFSPIDVAIQNKNVTILGYLIK